MHLAPISFYHWIIFCNFCSAVVKKFWICPNLRFFRTFQIWKNCHHLGSSLHNWAIMTSISYDVARRTTAWFGFFPSQTAILRQWAAQSQEKEKEMGGFCSAEASEMGNILVFSAVLWAFQKGRFRSFSRFGRWKKSPHFKEMAEDRRPWSECFPECSCENTRAKCKPEACIKAI